MENQVLKIIFTVFIGVMVALFIGFGIEAFYPTPPYPEDLANMWAEDMTKDEQAALQTMQNAYDASVKLRTGIASIVVTAMAVIIMFVSMFLEKLNLTLTNGLLLGGLFALVYGSGMGLSTGNAVVSFIIVGVGLAAVIVVGIRRFSPARKALDAAKP